MVRSPCFDSNGMKKGAWSEEEDNKLRAFILTHGHWNWRLLPKYAGLARCGKSCRLRWVNYLKPGVKRGNFTKHEEDLIIKLHAQFGNKWSIIATYFPGRTDNDIKNFWNAHIEKRRKRINPDANKLVKWKSTGEASHVLKEENLSSASLPKLEEPSLPFDAATFSQAADKVDIWPHHHNLPPLIDDQEYFFYHHYREPPSSESLYMSGFKWTADDDRDRDRDKTTSSEYVALDHTSNLQNGISCYDIPPPLLQEEGGFYDPFFDLYFSYGMRFLS